MKYQSGWDVFKFTMLSIVSMAVFVVPLVAWANSHDDKERENIETQNYLAVDAGKRLCKDSACDKCGLFEYQEAGFGTKRVVYMASLCELNWQNEQALVTQKKVDAEIRKKYEH
jgi:hypothetical protein